MKQYRVRRRYLCTLLDSNYLQTVEADYDVKETDDGVTIEELVYGSLTIINEKEGHA